MGASAHSILWIFIRFSTAARFFACLWGMPSKYASTQSKWLTASACVISLSGFATLGQKIFFSRARQVYNQDLYTRLIVVVNGGQFLWTTQLKNAKSGDYVTDKSVHC
jgi:hypothetical protein